MKFEVCRTVLGRGMGTGMNITAQWHVPYEDLTIVSPVIISKKKTLNYSKHLAREVTLNVFF